MPYYTQNWNFNFYRIPVYLKLSTPTKLRFEVSGGIYYSLLEQHNTDNNYSGDTYPKSDFGSIFSAGFVYPITPHVEAFIQGRYTTGSKEYISYNHGKTGTSELLIGIGYSGIFNKMKTYSHNYFMKDTSECRFSMKYRTGINISWVQADKNSTSYSAKTGFTSGVALNYSLGENCGIQAEVLYNNIGYQLKDSTSSSFRVVPNVNQNTNTYYTNTRIETSYFTIPLLFELKSSGPFTVYGNTGPYFSTLINATSKGYQVNELRNQGSYYAKTKTIVNNDITNSITPTDWGWIIGGGVQIPLVYNWKLDIEGRYMGSWSNILNIPPPPSLITDYGSTRSLTNRSFTLLFGLHIPIY
jgi:opacity protein-like surface antigen